MEYALCRHVRILGCDLVARCSASDQKISQSEESGPVNPNAVLYPMATD